MGQRRLRSGWRTATSRGGCRGNGSLGRYRRLQRTLLFRTVHQATAAHATVSFADQLEQTADVANRHRLAIVKALRILAADRPQERRVLGRLDPLGDDLLAKFMCQRHDGADDDRIAVAFAARLDQGLVDLDRVEGKTVQVGERGITGAEIVERQMDAGFLEEIEDVRGLLRVLHDERFGDLEAQRFALNGGGADEMPDLLHQVGLDQLPAGDVDGNEQRLPRSRQVLLPARDVVDGAAENIGAELHDEVGLLRHGHEIGG